MQQENWQQESPRLQISKFWKDIYPGGHPETKVLNRRLTVKIFIAFSLLLRESVCLRGRMARKRLIHTVLLGIGLAPVSRQAGKVGPGTHLAGKPVNQELSKNQADACGRK